MVRLLGLYREQRHLYNETIFAVKLASFRLNEREIERKREQEREEHEALYQQRQRRQTQPRQGGSKKGSTNAKGDPTDRTPPEAKKESREKRTRGGGGNTAKPQTRTGGNSDKGSSRGGNRTRQTSTDPTYPIRTKQVPFGPLFERGN